MANVTVCGPVTGAVGAELRRVRDSIGWTREHLAEHVSGIAAVTIAGYERGIRALKTDRMIELCQALQVSPLDVLHAALQRSGADLTHIGMWVDLRALLGDTAPEPLRIWAQTRLSDEPVGTTRVPWADIQEMGRLYRMPDLAERLVAYTPTPYTPLSLIARLDSDDG